MFNEKTTRLQAFPKTCPLNVFISELKGEKEKCAVKENLFTTVRSRSVFGEG